MIALHLAYSAGDITARSDDSAPQAPVEEERKASGVPGVLGVAGVSALPSPLTEAPPLPAATSWCSTGAAHGFNAARAPLPLLCAVPFPPFFPPPMLSACTPVASANCISFTLRLTSSSRYLARMEYSIRGPQY